MTLALIIGAITFTLFALFKMVVPFARSRREQDRFEVMRDELREIEELLARRAVVVQTLRELEFDRETEKIPEEDYEQQCTRLELEAVRIMRRLDELHGGHDWEEVIDRELERRLAGPRADISRLEGEEPSTLEEESAPQVATDATEDTRAGDEVAASDDADGHDGSMEPCPSCGKLMAAEARFCSQCGAPLGGELDEEPEGTEAAAAEYSTHESTTADRTRRQQ